MDNLHLIQLGQYERPAITEERNRDWVGIGDNNDYYQNLIDAYMDSTTNNAVINGIVNQIFGKGLEATDAAQKPEQYAQMKSLINENDLRNVCQDLKLLGEASFQITYAGKKIKTISHFPRETLRAEKMNDSGEVKNYYYAPDWSKVDKRTELKKFPVFGSGKPIEIYIIKRYVTGFYYYSPADYNTSYATLENEIACYLINDTQNGFSGTKVVNFNNGVPDREKQLSIKNDVMSKLTGSYGEKVSVAFNNNAESKTTVEDIPLNNAPEHYRFLSEECQRKIMVTHRVTSPLLIGLRDGNSGLGSNAEEIQNASRLFSNVVIQPYQNLLVSCLDTLLAINNISLNLYFKTIEPLEFMDLENIENDEEIEEQTGIKEEKNELDLSEEEINIHLQEAIELGETEEDLLERYDLVHEAEVDYELEDELDFVVNEINKTSKNKFASTGRAYPKSKSSQDGKSKKEGEEETEFLVRYYYNAAPMTTGLNSRAFCSAMTKAKKVYRKEDILKMGKKPVNAGFGKRGASTYSIWLYKGGARCSHRWNRKLYARKDGRDLGEAISTNKAIKRGFRPESNDNKVSIAPKNMKYAGYTASYWKEKGFKN